MATDNFHKDGSRYDSDVFKGKEKELMDSVNLILNTYFMQQIKNLQKHSVGLFEKIYQVQFEEMPIDPHL